ncbi:MAG: hypothetical protein K5654_02760 [Lachnospiraceae bacterium]|nr:hypothetical protein [Lachnospiraceae bacterium]
MNDEKEIITTTEEEKVANIEKEPVKEKKKKKFNKKWLLLLLIPGSVLLFFAYMICFPIHSGNNIYDWITGYKPEPPWTPPEEEAYYGPEDRDGDGTFDFYPLDCCVFDSDYLLSPLMDELSTWELVSNIIPESVRYEPYPEYPEGQIVYFSAKGPDGDEIRFWGYNVEPSNDGLKIKEEGRIMSLDSFGRVYSVDCLAKEYSEGNLAVGVFGGYDIEQNMHPGNMDNMAYTITMSGRADDVEQYPRLWLLRIQPYFFGVGFKGPDYKLHDPKDEFCNGTYVLSEVEILYRPETEMAALRQVMFNSMEYGCYIEGDSYEDWKEDRFSPYEGMTDFDIVGIPDLNEDYLELPLSRFDVWDPRRFGFELSVLNPKAGDLHDASGNVIDKKTCRVAEGMSLDVQFNNISFSVPLNLIETDDKSKTLHECVPAMYPEGTGELNILCIPISWGDEHNKGDDAKRLEICKSIGRVSDMEGNVKDYSDNDNMNCFSLSSYFDTSSYGKLQVTTYMTDWYQCDRPFSEMKGGVDIPGNELLDWLYETYPSMDWSKFDKNGDNYFDSVMVVNYGDMSKEEEYNIISYGGAVCESESYGAIQDMVERAEFNSMVYCNLNHFDARTLIHEFSHNLGLIDYYDVSYSGIDAVGQYDMQSNNYGEWNSFSKYAVGWIDPITVKDLEPGESVEKEIRPMSSSGDAIVIRPVGDKSNTPFSEYILVDLFANVGTNIYDAVQFGLQDIVGVRMYHIDARMEARDFIMDNCFGVFTENGVVPPTPTPIGTPHMGNNYKENGRYQVELIQAGAVNTFTKQGSGRIAINDSDFFKAGSKFTQEKYRDFFDDGKLDTGKDLGYSIEVVSIEGKGEDAKAVIRITRE